VQVVEGDEDVTSQAVREALMEAQSVSQSVGAYAADEAARRRKTKRTFEPGEPDETQKVSIAGSPDETQKVPIAGSPDETQKVPIAGGEMEDAGVGDDPAEGQLVNGTAEIKGSDMQAPDDSGGCVPLCKWACTSPICEEVCTPECAPPKCETRCETVELAGCKLECDQPECCTICPKKKPCAKHGCPTCTTTCSNPVCKLKCPQQQNCKTVCESPNCRWRCKQPESCPKPQCSMACETPKKDCTDSIQQKLPPLRKGELKVATFSPPSSFLQVSPGIRHAAGASKGQEVLIAALLESADGEARIVELPVST
jgi:hypothetical protein